MYRLILWLVFSWLLTSAIGQPSRTKELDLETFAQRLFNTQKEDVLYEDLYESLLQHYLHPLDLNRVTYQELAAMYILSNLQLQSFFDYRQKNGSLLSIYELQAIPNFDLPIIYDLLPFVQVHNNGLAADTRPLRQRLQSAPIHMLLLRYSQTLEQKEGFSRPDTGRSTPTYAGSPTYGYVRYRISHPGDFSMGFTLEKDAGEATAWQPATHRYGADFISGHALLENKGRWKRIILGDYQLQIGQGLLLSAGFSIGKGSETVETIRRSNLGIRPYTSTIETNYLRGAAATYALGQWHLTGFYSHAFRDASIDSLAGTTSALQTTGYHRTAHEIASKGNLLEQTTGADLSYTNARGSLEIGGTCVYTHFDTPIQPPFRRYNQFVFRGNEAMVVGLHYHYLWQNFNLFGEVARSENGGLGLVSGLMGSFSTKISLSMLFRHYDRHFYTFFGQAFGENTHNTNEQGLYWGLKLMPIRKLTCTLYYDTYQFPWLLYRVDAPSAGFDYMTRLTYQPSKKLRMYAQYRQAHNQQNNTEPYPPLHFLVPTLRKQYLLVVQFQATDHLRLQSRLQGSSFSKQQITKGYAMAQDIQLHFQHWQLSSRFALFDTDDFDNRQYLFEKDVLYSFSMPAYYQRGLRYYFLWQYDLTTQLSVWLRFSRTYLSNASVIGSGMDQIAGPQRTDVKVQIRYVFR